MQVLLKARKNVNQKTRFSCFESRNLLAMTESYTHVHVSLFFLEVNFFFKGICSDQHKDCAHEKQRATAPLRHAHQVPTRNNKLSPHLKKKKEKAIGKKLKEIQKKKRKQSRTYILTFLYTYTRTRAQTENGESVLSLSLVGPVPC